MTYTLTDIQLLNERLVEATNGKLEAVLLQDREWAVQVQSVERTDSVLYASFTHIGDLESFVRCMEFLNATN